jgi:multidrug efflux pump subunit AcrA (membrane-fusion protein)
MHMRVTKWTAANVVLAAVALTGGGLAYATVGIPSAPSTKAVTRTATIASGTVMTTVSSTGNVTAPNNVSVNFGTSGTLTEVDVAVGATVKQGQLLARVDSTAPKASLDSANAQLASAQANLTELQQGATALVQQSLQISNAQAAQQVVSAKTSLTNAEQDLGFDQTNLAAAITKAQQQLASDQASTTQDATTLQLAVTQAEAQEETQLTADESQLSGDESTASADQTQLNTDQAKLTADHGTGPTLAADTAAVAADQAKVSKDATTVAKDQATVTNDENASSVTNAQNSLTSGELRDQQTLQNDQTAISNAQTAQAQGLAKDQQSITNAQQGVTNAQLSLASTENNNAQKTAAPTTATLQTDQAAIEQAQAQVDTAKTTYEDTALFAPAAGTIGAINDTVGQTISAGTTSAAGSTTSSSTTGTSSSSSTAFITLTNLTGLQVVADVDEADSSKVVVGAPATVTLNALPTQEFAAHVLAVADSSTVVSNVVEYQVTFALNNTNPAIKPGMTAAVTVTTAKVDGVLNVTSSAVRTAGGTSYVLVMQPDGTQKQVDVVVGLKGDTTTEITGAVKAGDVVALPASTVATSSTTKTSTTGPGAGFGGGAATFGGGGLGGGRG